MFRIPDPILRLENTSSPTADYFQIRSNGASSADILALSAAGRLGIGSSTPLTKLARESTSGDTLTFSRNDTTNTTDDLLGKLSFFANDASAGGGGGTGLH